MRNVVTDLQKFCCPLLFKSKIKKMIDKALCDPIKKEILIRDFSDGKRFADGCVIMGEEYVLIKNNGFLSYSNIKRIYSTNFVKKDRYGCTTDVNTSNFTIKYIDEEGSFQKMLIYLPSNVDCGNAFEKMTMEFLSHNPSIKIGYAQGEELRELLNKRKK